MKKTLHYFLLLMLITFGNLALANEKLMVKDGPIEGISGYDFHYVLAENEDPKDAEQLQKDIIAYIKSHPAKDVYINENFLAFDKKYNATRGPWKRAMWSLQIGTLPSSNEKGEAINEANPAALAADKREAIYHYMLKLAQFAKNTITEKGYKGSLFIHAVIYPDASDFKKERIVHYQTGWLVYGDFQINDPNNFRDVWTSSLIPMEAFIKQQMKAGYSKEAIKKQFMSKFIHDPFYTTPESRERTFKMIYKGQEDLKNLQANELLS